MAPSINSRDRDDLGTATTEYRRAWHYTDFNGLKGIIDGALRASSIIFLNDTEEFHHGAKLALEVVQNQLALAAHKYGHDEFKFLEGWLDTYFSRSYDARDVFVASLSTKAR